MFVLGMSELVVASTSIRVNYRTIENSTPSGIQTRQNDQCMENILELIDFFLRTSE